MSKPFTLDTTFLNLRPDDSVTTIKAGPRFWATIGRRTDLDDGRLVTVNRQARNWPHWERHPAGDEVLVLLSGELQIVLEHRGRTRRVTLKAGHSLIVPKGVWHRAVIRKPGNMLFITPGAGTEHRPLSAKAGL
jgi:mannose-6-phosphate isomerase-like protein (cupin superfamily)